MRLCNLYVAAFASILGFVVPCPAIDQPATLKQGDSFALNGHPYTLRTLDTLPDVDSDYSRRFKFDRYDNPKLKELRATYHLDEVVAPGKDEFERQFLLQSMMRSVSSAMRAEMRRIPEPLWAVASRPIPLPLSPG